MNWNHVWELFKINLLYANPQAVTNLQKRQEKTKKANFSIVNAMLRQQLLILVVFTVIYSYLFVGVDYKAIGRASCRKSVIPIHTSLAKMDHSLVEAASDLGANRFQTFTKVILKLSLPGVINGVSMVFLLSISSFVIPQLLGGHQFVLIGNLIENQFISVGDWNFGSSISVILAVIILAMMGFMKKIDPDENGGN